MLQEDRLAVGALARLDGRQVIRNDRVEPFLVGEPMIEGYVRHGGAGQFLQFSHRIPSLHCPQPKDSPPADPVEAASRRRIAPEYDPRR